jgi:hypothetical protein
MIDTTTKDAFWLVVQDCLSRFHGVPPNGARKLSADLRERIEHPPTGMSSDIFYHAEPFDVANDIVGKPLDLGDYQGVYDEIVSKHGW